MATADQRAQVEHVRALVDSGSSKWEAAMIRHMSQDGDFAVYGSVGETLLNALVALGLAEPTERSGRAAGGGRTTMIHVLTGRGSQFFFGPDTCLPSEAVESIILPVLGQMRDARHGLLRAPAGSLLHEVCRELIKRGWARRGERIDDTADGEAFFATAAGFQHLHTMRMPPKPNLLRPARVLEL